MERKAPQMPGLRLTFERLSPQQKAIHKKVEERGWAVVAQEKRLDHDWGSGVFLSQREAMRGKKSQDETDQWQNLRSRSIIHTVGLFAGFSHPEMVIAGLPAPTGAAILNRLARDIKEKACSWEAPGALGEALGAKPLKGVCAHHAWALKEMRPCAMYSELVNLPVMQIMWPDLNGFFPGEEGFDKDLEWAQPNLAAAPDGWEALFKKKTR